MSRGLSAGPIKNPEEHQMNGPPCDCAEPHAVHRIVLTGGPGAGKTAVLELVRKHFCRHVRVLPEAASMLFGGGFPRSELASSKKAAQRAIFHVQRELENLADHEQLPGHLPSDPGTQLPALIVCDRGTLDGVAYWPGSPDQMLTEVGTTIERELSHYAAVIHLRTPTAQLGYNHSNALRTEPAAIAAEIDRRIADAWRDHPRRFVVDSRADFLSKATEALGILRDEMPICCRGRRDPGAGGAALP